MDDDNVVLTPMSKKAIHGVNKKISPKSVEVDGDVVSLSPKSKNALKVSNSNHVVELQQVPYIVPDNPIEKEEKPKYGMVKPGLGTKALIQKKLSASRNNRFDSADYFSNIEIEENEKEKEKEKEKDISVTVEDNKYKNLNKGAGAKALLEKKLAASRNNRFDSADYYSNIETEEKKEEEEKVINEPKKEESTTNAKYGNLNKGAGAKALLQKKLAASKNNRFDSADYYKNNM